MTGYAVGGRTVAITGAAGGLGVALGKALRARGAQVALLGLDAGRVQAATLGASDVARGWAADVRDLDGPHHVMSEVRSLRPPRRRSRRRRHPRTGRRPERHRTRRLGPRGRDQPPWRLAHAESRGQHVIEQRGHLLAMSSMIGFLHPPLLGAYAASKAGVWALCDNLRLEMRPAGVTVGSVHPTIFRTPMTAGGFDSPAAIALVGDLSSGVFKATPLDTVVADIVRGIERRSSRVITPRRFAAVQYAPGVLQAVADRTFFRPAGIRRAVELATPSATQDRT